jgi:hypothetical protein
MEVQCTRIKRLLFLSKKLKELTHKHKQLIPERNSGEYNPMYQHGQQVMPHPTKPPDLHPHPKPNKPVDPQPATSQQLQVQATHTKNC